MVPRVSVIERFTVRRLTNTPLYSAYSKTDTTYTVCNGHVNTYYVPYSRKFSHGATFQSFVDTIKQHFYALDKFIGIRPLNFMRSSSLCIEMYGTIKFLCGIYKFMRLVLDLHK